MSRDRAWINTDQMEREDVAQLMMDEMVDIKLLRWAELGDDDGFRKQNTERRLNLVRVIKGRIDRRTQIFRGQDGEVSKSVDHLFIATVYFKDLRTNDVLEVNHQQYKVKFVNKVGQGFSEAEIEVET